MNTPTAFPSPEDRKEGIPRSPVRLENVGPAFLDVYGVEVSTWPEAVPVTIPHSNGEAQGWAVGQMEDNPDGIAVCWPQKQTGPSEDYANAFSMKVVPRAKLEPLNPGVDLAPPPIDTPNFLKKLVSLLGRRP